MSDLGTRKEFRKQMFLHLGQMFYDNSALIAFATKTYCNWKLLPYFRRGKEREKKYQVSNRQTKIFPLLRYSDFVSWKGTEQQKSHSVEI